LEFRILFKNSSPSGWFGHDCGWSRGYSRAANTGEGGTLSVSGERKAEKEEKNRKLHRVERYYGRFVRSFSIPEDAEDGKVNAEFKDGVLRVHLAKSEKARPKQIEVKVS
jgi:HSP20 family protein